MSLSSDLRATNRVLFPSRGRWDFFKDRKMKRQKDAGRSLGINQMRRDFSVVQNLRCIRRSSVENSNL